jgi:group II intron reverse transcriptase/maturase
LRTTRINQDVLMLSATVEKRLNAIPEVSKQGKRINGLFRLMEHQELWMMAYAKIHANAGASTPGVDGSSMDGFSEDRVENLIELLRENRYTPKPVRRVYIPKKDGRKRPLGIPSGDDKLVQEVVRMLLERIYEPVFSNRSHGFRPGRSCHTALKETQSCWDGTKWLVEMDIQGFYDNIDHDILVKLLEKKIDDKRFIKIIRSMLKAGYMEDWTLHRTYSGTPQGGICSPILANIYLHELDRCMEDIQREFDLGKKRKDNPAYSKDSYYISKLRTEHDQLGLSEEQRRSIRAKIRKLEHARRAYTAGDPFDEGFRRLHYCRYADDFIIGITGSKREAVEIMARVRKFLLEELNLTVAEEKSGIRHSRSGIQFLGYDMRIYSAGRVTKVRRKEKVVRVKSYTERMQLHIPREKIRKFSKAKGYGEIDKLRPMHKGQWLHRSDAEIILAYNAEIRGFANYYSLATSAKTELKKVVWLWQGSLVKTLAGKHQTSVRAIYRRLKQNGKLELKTQRDGKKKTFRVFALKDLKAPKQDQRAIDQVAQVARFTFPRTELVQRLNAEQCEYCGREKGYFEVHHVKKLKDLRGKTLWEQQLAAMQRKTMVLCRECHELLHQGRLPHWKQKEMKGGEPDSSKR